MEGTDDAPFQLRSQAMAGGRLDDHANEDVPGVAVGPGRAGGEQRRVGGRDAHELLRPPPEVQLAGQVWIQRARIVQVVEQAARVVQELPDADRIAAGDEPGQPVLDRVAQRQGTLTDELEGHRGHEGLRDAAGAESQVGAHGPAGGEVGHSSRDRERAVVVTSEQHGAGDPFRQQPIEGGANRGRPCLRFRLCLGRRRHDDRHEGDDDGRRAHSMLHRTQLTAGHGSS